MPNTTAYDVDGMTCSHCAHAVTAEVSKIPGVRAVRVDLTTNRVSVDWAQPLSDADVRLAVEDAGYTLR